MTVSVYLANKMNDHVLRNTAYTSPTSVWIALFTADTGLDDNSPSAEVSGFNYSRLEVGGATGRSWTVSAAKLSENTENWEFPAATGGNWGTIVATAVMDASTAGNVLYWGPLTASRAINDGQIFRFLAGELDSLFS